MDQADANLSRAHLDRLMQDNEKGEAGSHGPIVGKTVSLGRWPGRQVQSKGESGMTVYVGVLLACRSGLNNTLYRKTMPCLLCVLCMYVSEV